MIGILVLFACRFVSSQTMARAALCNNDNNCAPQFYCDTSSYLCKECQHCEEWKRKPLAHIGEQCVRSIIQCGVCLDGYIETEDGFRSPCVPPSSAASSPGVPVYVWIIVSVLALLAMLVVLIVYVMRSETFKLKIRTWIQGPSESHNQPAEPSAPEAPPPYNMVYEPAQATPPYSVYQPTTMDIRHVQPVPASSRDRDEEEESLIKVSLGGEGRTQRTVDTRQAARVFNKPHYVRGPHLPTSDETGVDSDHEPSLHDENTVESLWTQHETNNNTTVSISPEEAGATAASSLPGYSAAANKQLARPAAPPAQPPAKVRCVRQEGSSNCEEEGPSLSSDIASIEQHGPSFNINFTQNIFAVQRNDISQ